MILTRKDLAGSMLDKPEYQHEFDKNMQLFLDEFREMEALAPNHPGWGNALYNCEIFKGSDGFRVAFPTNSLPLELTDRAHFQGYMLSKTVFPNQFQAVTCASRIVRQRMGN